MVHEVYFDDIEVGSEMPPLVKGPLKKLQFVIYAGASGDFNPLHTDDDFARSVGMPDGAIAQGMLVMGFVGQAITSWIPRRRLRRFGVRFTGVTRQEDTITVAGRVTDKRVANGENLLTCEVTASDASCDVKVAGSFTAALPARG